MNDTRTREAGRYAAEEPHVIETTPREAIAIVHARLTTPCAGCPSRCDTRSEGGHLSRDCSVAVGVKALHVLAGVIE